MSDAAAFQDRLGRALVGELAIADPHLARALAVHRNTATKAAIDALADNHPVTAALVGADAFAAAAADYVEVRPPAEPRLCLYGDGFAPFLADRIAFAELPYLADIAALERMVTQALFAADAGALDGAAIGARLSADGGLAVHPAARWAAFASPAVAIWHAHQPDAASDALDELAWAAEYALVTRPQDAVLVTAVSPAALDFLDACAGGRSLVDAAAMVGDDLPVLFAALIAAGAFA